MPYDVFSEQFLRHYKARYGFETVKSHTSIVNEFKRFLDLIGVSCLSDITPAIINKYITYLRESKKNRSNTCNNHLKNLYCPKVEVNDAKPKGALSAEDIQRFLKIAKKKYPFYYPIYYTFLSTGLRFTELINLKWVDLDFESKILMVMKPKGKKKPDYISMPDDLVGLLKSLPKRSDYVFTNERGEPFPYRTRKLIRRLKKIIEQAEIKSISTLHELRHTYCSQLFNVGFSSKEAQKAMRHTDLNITEGYAHIFMPEYNKKIKRLDKVVRIGT
jgi:integrase/recombinase XerD